ncbi:hypothetical protein R50073_01270 [Maricurvus nonylphenolicus]|uniref:hypothetical protein n=1 Tax=Maricurvus nonylphenolicus TaxID=1008307 RepID=UPI0036F321F5
MSKRVASYKYDIEADPSFNLRGGRLAKIFWLVLIGIGLVVISDSFGGKFAFLAAIFLVFVGSSIFKNKNRSITIGDSFVVVGSEVFFFENMESIRVCGDAGTCKLVSKDGSRETTIKRNRFSSNANKDWKISKHQEEKFKKVVGKLIKNSSSYLGEGSLVIRNFGIQA